MLDVLTHAHRGKLASSDEKYKDEVAPEGSPFRPLYDDQIRFNGQPIALVVAEEFEIARFAASLVRVDYEAGAHVTDFDAQRQRTAGAKHPKPLHTRGNADARVRRGAGARRAAEYGMPVEHHNPMEPYAATAVWEGDDAITIYDKTQGPLNCRNYVANVFGMKPRQGAGALALCRRRLRIGLAPEL